MTHDMLRHMICLASGPKMTEALRREEPTGEPWEEGLPPGMVWDIRIAPEREKGSWAGYGNIDTGEEGARAMPGRQAVRRSADRRGKGRPAGARGGTGTKEGTGQRCRARPEPAGVPAAGIRRRSVSRQRPPPGAGSPPPCASLLQMADGPPRNTPPQPGNRTSGPPQRPAARALPGQAGAPPAGQRPQGVAPPGTDGSPAPVAVPRARRDWPGRQCHVITVALPLFPAPRDQRGVRNLRKLQLSVARVLIISYTFSATRG
jgi:hypothetical protein